MVNLSKFAETLGELMFDRGIKTSKALAEALGLPEPTISRYRNALHMPTVSNLLLIADFFECSTDFLLGREEQFSKLSFRKCPVFSEQIVTLVAYSGLSGYAFYRRAKIPESTFFEWKNGSSVPTLESIVKIADEFDYRVDFVLGRE